MFKFKIINKIKIGELREELLLNKMLYLQEESIPLDNQDATSIIVTDRAEQDIIGGISLVKKELNALGEDIRMLIPSETLFRGYIWECSTLCCAHPQELSCPPSPSEHFFRLFYRTLYEGIVEFGAQKEVGFVVAKLTVDAYLPTKDLGLWPYVAEFSPREFSDDFFYGVLPLRGCFYDQYQKTLKDLDEGQRI